ncbi:hypothetical protein Bca52824_073882 [Brassica carinata]|uniref:Uncharacterized protein n=1 Tax=Brassica carinata TaxID=52824 RepID=A0A8X7QBX0_BRACI|nr:hypothetical protein Bca52824_073882 [Brassica carinata]
MGSKKKQKQSQQSPLPSQYQFFPRTTAPPVPNRRSPPGVSDYPPPRQLFQDSHAQTEAASAHLPQPSPPPQPRRSEKSAARNGPSSSEAQDSASTERPEAVNPTLSDGFLRQINELISQPNRGRDIPILSPNFEPGTTWDRDRQLSIEGDTEIFLLVAEPILSCSSYSAIPVVNLPDAPQYMDQYMEPVQDGAQDDQIIPTEVRATDQAVYRIDPRKSGKDLRLEPRLDDRTDQTEACLPRTTRQAKTDVSSAFRAVKKNWSRFAEKSTSLVKGQLRLTQGRLGELAVAVITVSVTSGGSGDLGGGYGGSAAENGGVERLRAVSRLVKVCGKVNFAGQRSTSDVVAVSHGVGHGGGSGDLRRLRWICGGGRWSGGVYLSVLAKLLEASPLSSSD